MSAIDQLKAIDIRELLPPGREHELRNNQGRCPFPAHGRQSGKTGAFTYYPNNNSCYCFVCDLGGTAIDFWMHMHGFDFRQAVEDLAQRHNITLDEWTPEQEARLAKEKRREEALAFAAAYYHQKLMDNGPVLQYLLDRGFTRETIQAQRIGFANKQLIAALKGDPQALADKGLALEDFVIHIDEDGRPLPGQEASAGLIIQAPTGGLRDYLRDRITFPLILRNRVTHMSGRDLPASLGGKSERKYLNLRSPLTALYLEDAIRETAFVFEGLPDTLTAYQWGLPACGQQGTNGMDKHAHKFRKCREVFLCFDTDGPGTEAAIKAAKAIHLALESGGVRLVRLPEAFKDLNDYAQAHGVDEFKELAAKAQPLIAFLIDRLPAELPALDKEREIKEVLRLVAHLGTYARDEAIELIKKKFGGSKADLRAMLNGVAQEAVATKAESGADEASVVLDYSDTREIVPVQDFAFNSPAMGNYTTFVKVTRKIATDDGRLVPVTRQEALLVRITHESPASSRIEQHLVATLSLTQAERRRVPFEAGVRGRWRTDRRHLYSVERFVKGQVGAVSGRAIFNEIAGLLRRYICFPDPADADVVTLYIMGTYIYRLFPAYGYLHLHGIRESGKSNVARIIAELGFNSMLASNITGPVMFRMLQATCGTVIIDEAEKLNNPKPDTPAADLMLMMNDGYKRGGRAYRADFNEATKQHEPVAFDIYSPKVFASIAELQYVLASRCIIIPCLRATSEEMKKAGIKDIAQNEHRLAPLFAELRDRLHCWGLTAFPQVHDMYSNVLLEAPGLDHLRGREREIWLPLIAIAGVLDNEAGAGDPERMEAMQAAGELLSERVALIQAAKEKVKRVTETDESIELGVLKSVYDVVANSQVMPARPATLMDKGNWYVVAEVLEKVNNHLHGMGQLGPDRNMASNRFVSILSKTQAIGAVDRKVFRFGDETRRCVRLEGERLKSVIFRLGGVMDDEESA